QDGIRDRNVTGVQTCALPIFGRRWSGPLLPAHLRQIRRPVAGVVGSDIGIGLLELRMLAGGDRHISHDVQTVPAAGGPAGDDGDDDLRHGADEALDLEDVQAPGTSRIDTLTGLPGGVLVAGAAADALVAAGAERPTAVLGTRAVAGQQHRTDIRGLA